jgi:hypothetical protein
MIGGFGESSMTVGPMLKASFTTNLAKIAFIMKDNLVATLKVLVKLCTTEENGHMLDKLIKGRQMVRERL